MTEESKAPKWLEDILDQLNSPQDTILTDPANTKKVLENLNMAACRFDHADGEVRMGVYVPCADPKTKEGVGLAVIFLGDDTRLYRRAKSIQGVHLEEAAQDLLSEYMKTFNRPSAKAEPAPEERFDAVWEAGGFEILSTGGGMWAAIKEVGGVEFWVTDDDQSDNPNPNEALTVGAYVPNSGMWLEFTNEVANKAEADRQLEQWAAQLQEPLKASLAEEARTAQAASKPARGMEP